MVECLIGQRCNARKVKAHSVLVLGKNMPINQTEKRKPKKEDQNVNTLPWPGPVVDSIFG